MTPINTLNRALQVQGNSSYLNKILSTFGIPLNKPTFPTVFQEKYQQEWEAFTRSFKPVPSTPREIVVLLLEFLKYTNYMGVNPFKSSVKDPISQKKFNTRLAEKTIVFSDLETIYNGVQTSLRKLNLFSYLVIKQSKDWVHQTGTSYEVATMFVLRPKRPEESMDSVLQKLSGFLYEGQLPAQLQDVVKLNYKKSSSALPNASEFLRRAPGNLKIGWLPLEKSSLYSLQCKRVKDGILLLLKFTFNPGVRLPSSNATKLITTAWKSFRKE